MNMPDKTTRRGYDPDDIKWFLGSSLSVFKTAQEEVQWLLDRGYKAEGVVEFVGNHHQLSSRQRIALKRICFSTLKYVQRKKKLLPFEAAIEGCLNIDGFNLIITLEVALSGSLLLLGKDDVFRDLAGLRGSYSLIGYTDKALDLIGITLTELSVPCVKFFLDAPISNSGRLRELILEHAKTWKIPVEVVLVNNPDVVLSAMERVVTGDSVILDACASWLNLSKKIIRDHIKDAWVLESL